VEVRVFRSIRQLLVVILGSTLCAAAIAQEMRVKFTLDWLIDGQQTPFILTHGKGYFAQQGVNVMLDAGIGSAGAVQRVASGTYDMGYGDSSALIEHLSSNPDPAARVQAVYMTQDATPAGILALKKSNILKPKDLEGRTVAGAINGSERKLFPIFARVQGIDPASIKWQNMQPSLIYTLLARGQVEAAGGFPPFMVGTMGALGVKPDELVLLNFKDYGVNVYGNAVLVNRKFMQENPKAVAAFLRAYNQGLKETVANPDEAIKYVQQREPTINVVAELVRLKALIPIIATPNARANGVGEASKVRLQRQIEDVGRAYGLERLPSVDDVFTPAFLPPRAERML
jgi:NitT/TauT family transport system substrate-binding protein